MEIFDDGDRMKVTDSVKVTRGEIVARCGVLDYFKQSEKILLTDQPKAYRKKNYLTGRQMILILDHSEITEIQILEEAYALTRVDSLVQLEMPFDLLSGEKILISVNEDAIDTVKAQGRATAYYHLMEDNEETGFNKVLGDELTMFVAEDELKDIKVKSSPSSSTGIFYPTQLEKPLIDEMNQLLTKLGIKENESWQGTF